MKKWILLPLLLAACRGPQGSMAVVAATFVPRPQEAAYAECTYSLPITEVGQVKYVLDGDTIDVQIIGTNDRTYRVRYIGIDTPERGEDGWADATTINAAFVEDRTVQLVRDVSDVDRYGRLLRYVFVDEVFVNYELVAQGYARPAEYPPDTACAETFRTAR